ncbi:MAG: shikimate dehydrogenase [Sandaracinaceae bacterium]
MGHPIAHSLSPAMHTAALAALGVDGRYDALDVAPDALAAALSRLRLPPEDPQALDGVNVTIPHKIAVIAHLDEVEPDALAVGAVNTVVRDGARLVGANTDVEGLARSLDEAGATLADRVVAVLGAGGAARAAIAAAERSGAREVTVIARDLVRARALAATRRADARGVFGAVALTDAAAVRATFSRTDVLVQATSATMGPEADTFVAGLPLDALPAHAWVTDLVYRPRRTAFLGACEARGLRTIDGLGMLVHQGALSLSRWLGLPATAMPFDAMRAALSASTRRAS